MKAEEVRKDDAEATAGPAGADRANESTARPADARMDGDIKGGDVKSGDVKAGDDRPGAHRDDGAEKAAGAKEPTAAVKGDERKPAATEAAAKSKPAANASSGGSFLGHLATAVIGAVLGIFGISFANNQGLLPEDFDLSGGGVYRQQIIALEDKISALEARATGGGADSLGGRLAALTRRIDETEAKLGQLAEGTPLSDKVAALETTIGDLEAAAKTGEGGKLAGLTAVTKELTRANDQAAKLSGEFVKMREEQSAFREDLAALRSGQADFHIVTARLTDEIAKLQTGQAKLTADMSRPPDVSSQIDPLANAVKTLRTDVDGLVDRESGSRAEGRNIALALSLGELKRAVNQGVPYRAELERVTPHAPRNLDLAPLRNHADAGLVTMTALRDEFASLSNTALAAETTASSGSLVDQLMANAKALVQVRPTGLVEGDGTSAVLSRLEYRLIQGDLAAALQESRKLAGEPAKVMQPWLVRAAARLDADTLLVTLEDRIRNSLAGVPAQ